jgi:hypothetical protein
LSPEDGGSSVSHEEFNVALETLKASMMTEVKGMFKEFLEGLKLSTAPLEVVDPANKVVDANSNKGEASSGQVPLNSGKSGSGIFAHVEPPLTYGGPVPSMHMNHVGPPPKLLKNEDFAAWVYRFKRHLNHSSTNVYSPPSSQPYRSFQCSIPFLKGNWNLIWAGSESFAL